MIALSLTVVRGTAQREQAIRVNKYTQSSGLSSFGIRKIICDHFGFLWIGTQDGLNRFDGSHFAVFNKGLAKNGLLGFDVRDLIEMPARDELIAMTGTGGINVINTVTGTVTRSFSTNYSDENVWNRCMVLAGGEFWLGTNNGIYLYNANTGAMERSIELPFQKRKSDDLFSVTKILEDRFNRIWCFVDDYGVVVYRAADKKVVAKFDLSELALPAETSFSDAVLVGDTTMLIGSFKGMRRLELREQGGIAVDRSGMNPALYGGEIYCIGVAGNSVYVGMNSGLSRWDRHLATGVRFMEEEDPLAENWLMSVGVLYLKGDVCWLGCKNGLGYSRMDLPALGAYFYDRNSNQKLDDVFSLLSIGSSGLLVGLEHGLKLVDTKTSAFMPIDSIKTFYGLQRVPDGNVLASTEKETLVLHNGRLNPISQFYEEFSGLDHVTYNSAIYYGDSLEVLGTESPNGLVLWNYRGRHVRNISTGTEPNNISSNTVNSLFRDSLSRLWVLSDNIISIYDDHFRRLSELVYKDRAGKPVPYYFCMCETKDDYWICTYGEGILKVNKKSLQLERTFSVKDGLSNNGVYKIFNYRNQYLVITSNNGVSMYELASGKFYNVYREDGLHGNNFEENVGVFCDSVIYAGGLHGVSRIWPSRFASDTVAPALFFSSIKVERRSGVIDTSNLRMQDFSIPSDRLQTTVGFSALSYMNPSRVEFAYKIQELKGDWIQLGNQHFVNLIGLEPGKYTLVVKAKNADGVWSEPRSLILDFLPAWYQTLWFELLVGAVIAAILYLFYRYRIGQVRKQQRIRREIANDLHDDLGSTLTTVKILAQIAKRSPGDIKNLDQIEDSVSLASTGLRDMIWVLDDARDSLKDFMERIKAFLMPITIAKSIQLELGIVGESTDRLLSKAEKRNLLMIVKETVNNCIKYSDCQTIRIQAKLVDKKICLSIYDDGKGFDCGEPTEGNGLKNIGYRARQIHYSVKVVSRVGEGTVIEVSQG
jgi:ligand-binding sensor domain-containing protein